MAGEYGVYTGYPEAEYHRHPALSASGAKKLLPPSCPAIFKWERDNGQPSKRAFDFGHAAHAKVLGVGAEVVVVQKTAKDGTGSDADDYRTKSAQEHAEAIRAEGKVPLLAHEVAQVDAMAAALRQHPFASALFDPARGGEPEQSAFWHDATHAVDRRCRFDWLPATDGGRLIIPDYKSAASAQPRVFARAAAAFSYHQQDAWYRDTALALGLAEDVVFVFVVQEKTAPYVVTVCELDAEAVYAGRRRNDLALEVFAECTATGVWPGYSDEVELISLPDWATYDLRNAA
jgi:hypothetical protein